MADPTQGGGTGGADQSAGGGGAPNAAPNVDLDDLAGKVAASLEPKVASMVTGAVKRNVASVFDGIDLDTLKELSQPKPKGKGKKDDGTVDESAVALRKLQDQVDALQKGKADAEKRANLSGVRSALADKGVDPDVLGYVARELAATVRPDQAGNLYVHSEDNGMDKDTPLAEAIDALVKSQPGILKKELRLGSGAGAQTGGWTEAMPRTAHELMFDPKTKKPTPQRWARFKDAHPEEAQRLREAMGGNASVGILSSVTEAAPKGAIAQRVFKKS